MCGENSSTIPGSASIGNPSLVTALWRPCSRSAACERVDRYPSKQVESSVAGETGREVGCCGADDIFVGQVLLPR